MLSNERRYKALTISPEFILQMFNPPEGHVYQISFPREIPHDVKVIDVGYRIEYRGFILILEHPSFDPVPEGTPAPEIISANCELIELEKLCARRRRLAPVKL